ncbi:MAG: class I SAM-dependent methyltransferase [Proteobacteria bacterium]|nr:class I SAM-dependent methyltransferase [Pseudomonadota bacterium]NBP15291.1 class I SAM-dependent methyltransferase [bacterium]
MNKSKEKQYQFMVEQTNRLGSYPMSIRASTMWRIDPKLLSFTLARHKFVAKMFSGFPRVLEVGCGDAFASRLLHPEVKEIHSIDFDPVFINDARKRLEPGWPVTLAVHDILKDGPYTRGGKFDGAFSLDVIEHIPRTKEDLYLRNIAKSLQPQGVFICGSPSLESQPHASLPSKAGHINCKSGKALRGLLGKHFHNTFLFGMNDEVLHTGFAPMCHYLFVLAVGPRD